MPATATVFPGARAVALQVSEALGARSAAIDNHANAYRLTNGKARDGRTDLEHRSHDLVTGNNGVMTIPPVTPHRVNVGVTDAGVSDGNPNVSGLGSAPLAPQQRERDHPVGERH